ncbi:MAG: selenoneine biosynthesis selenosugar synthase SenB [Candidatus Binatia bacterium]
MKIVLACPAPARTRHGNRVTALRWSRILRELGHRVRIVGRWRGEACDLLVALHARKSAPSVEALGRSRPEAPIVVALTGTDVYRDIHRSRRAMRVLDRAWRLVALQPLALAELPRRLRPRARVIHQSAPALRRRRRSSAGRFDVCVLAHLRPEKDPFRAALAARRLPPSSRIRIVHAGRALSAAIERRARRESARNPRWIWLGERSRTAARALLARSRILVLSSRMEGGANVITEALAARVPILASRIPGTVGLLGSRYPGYFPAGDTAALAALLHRAETEPELYRRLARACSRLSALASPRRERDAWRRLLAELPGGGGSGGVRIRSRPAPRRRDAPPRPGRAPTNRTTRRTARGR